MSLLVSTVWKQKRELCGVVAEIPSYSIQYKPEALSCTAL